MERKTGFLGLDLLKVIDKKKHIPQMVVSLWFTMVESKKITLNKQK